jgi:CRP/FNR family transcriptional regulator
MDPAETLLRTPLFCGVSRRDVDALLPSVGRLAFARGQLLWNEGDRAEALYVIATGQVKGYRVSADGTEVILNVASDGAVLGEVGIFHRGGTRLVSVAAMAPTLCLTIASEPLLDFMSRHPTVLREMLAILSERAGQHAYFATDLAFDDIRRRVARTLLELAAEQGERVASGVRIRIKLSQTALAAMVAASRENVNRVLAPFLERGEISHADGFFVVHDPKGLEEAVDAPR